MFSRTGCTGIYLWCALVLKSKLCRSPTTEKKSHSYIVDDCRLIYFYSHLLLTVLLRVWKRAAKSAIAVCIRRSRAPHIPFTCFRFLYIGAVLPFTGGVVPVFIILTDCDHRAVLIFCCAVQVPLVHMQEWPRFQI